MFLFLSKESVMLCFHLYIKFLCIIFLVCAIVVNLMFSQTFLVFIPLTLCMLGNFACF